MQHLRRRLLETALNGLNKVAAQGVDANIKEMAMAGAYRRMGDIYLELGKTDEALQQYRQCHAIIEHLAAEKTLPNPHANLSFSQMNMGDAAPAGNLPVAKDCFLEALRIRREWAAAEPKDKELPQKVAETLGRLGTVCLELGQLADARQFFEESLHLREQWQKADPKSAAAQQELAGAHSAMGRINLKMGRLEDAIRFSEMALEAMAGLLQSRPQQSLPSVEHRFIQHSMWCCPAHGPAAGTGDRTLPACRQSAGGIEQTGSSERAAAPAPGRGRVRARRVLRTARQSGCGRTSSGGAAIATALVEDDPTTPRNEQE